MTAIAEASSFQERMFERIKAQMGELMTAEELKALVEKSVHEAFFKERTSIENPGTYQARAVPKESLFVELMRDELHSAMAEHARAHVQQWFKDNPTVYRDAVDSAIAKGFTRVVLQQVDSALTGPLANLSMAVQSIAQGRSY